MRTPRKVWPRCQATGKRTFATELEADSIVARAQYRARILDDRRRRETRSYRCSACTGWHLTSQPLNQEGAA